MTSVWLIRHGESMSNAGEIAVDRLDLPPDQVLDLRRPAGNMRQHGVEERVVHHVDSSRGQSGGYRASMAVDAPGDRGQAVGTVVTGVHRRHHRQQHLRGADIAGRLVSADVLLSGLQRQPVGRCAVGVHRHPNQPAGKLAGMGGSTCEMCS